MASRPARGSQGIFKKRAPQQIFSNFSHLSGEVLIDTIWESSNDAKAVVPYEVLLKIVRPFLLNPLSCLPTQPKHLWLTGAPGES